MSNDPNNSDGLVEVELVKGDAVDTAIPVAMAKRTLVNESETIQPRVYWEKEHRKFHDKPWGILYIISFLLFLGLGSFLVVNAVPRYEFVSIGGVESNETVRIVSRHFRDDVRKCCANKVNTNYMHGLCSEVNMETAKERKHLLTSDSSNAVDYNISAYDDDYAATEIGLWESKYEKGDGIFDAFLEAPEILATLSLLALVLALVWAVLLRFCAVPIVYATEMIKVGGLVYLAVKAFQNEADVAGIVSLVCAATVIAWDIYTRKQLVFAGKMLAEAARAFKENASVFFAFIPILLIYAGNAGLFVLFFARSFENVEVQDVGYSCEFVSPSYTTGMVCYLSLAYLWSILLFSTMRLSIIANVIGAWHFHPDNTPSLLEAVGNSCTTSLGTLAGSSLISTVAEKLNRMFAKDKLVANCFNPVFWVTLPLYCIFGTCLHMLILMLTKFSVILHVFTGKSWMGSANKVYKILKRHFIGGFVTEVASSSVLNLGCYVFSIGVFFIAWLWLDQEFKTDTFIGVSDEAVWAVGWAFFALFNIYYPVLGLYLIILLNRWLSFSKINASPAVWVTPLAATFIACLAMMFFHFLSATFLDAVDTLFLCFAVDRDNKRDLQEDEFAKLVFEGVPNVLIEPALEKTESGDEEEGAPVSVAAVEAPRN